MSHNKTQDAKLKANKNSRIIVTNVLPFNVNDFVGYMYIYMCFQNYGRNNLNMNFHNQTSKIVPNRSTQFPVCMHRLHILWSRPNCLLFKFGVNFSSYLYLSKVPPNLVTRSIFGDFYMSLKK